MPQTAAIHFDTAAAVIMLVTLSSFVLRRMTKGAINRIYIVAMALVTITTLASLGGEIYDMAIAYGALPGASAESGQPPLGRDAFTLVYYTLRSLTAPIYLLLIATVSDTTHLLDKNLCVRIFLWTPMIATLLLVMTNPLHHLVYYYVDGALCYGFGIHVLNLSSAYYSITGIVWLLRWRRLLNKIEFYTLLVSYPFVLFSLVAHFAFPEAPIEMFVTSVVMMLISAFVIHPELRLDSIVDAANLREYDEMCQRAFESEKALCLVYLEIVNYERMRGIMGKDELHNVVRRIGTGLSKRLERDDVLYYLRAGLFCIAPRNTDPAHAIRIAQRAHEEGMARSAALRERSAKNEMRTCIVRVPEDAHDADTLKAFIRRFAHLVPQSCVTTYSELSMRDNFELEMSLSDIIARAIREKSFTVEYQPIWHLESDRARSAEALARLYDPKFGWIPPELFIPAAEESGAIVEIGQILFDKICSFLSKVDFEGLGLDYVEVNLSIDQCVHPGMAEALSSVVRSHGIDPRRMNLEITETSSAYSQRIVSDNMRVLASEGFTFSLDDYGTGYSNVTRMLNLPFSLIKFDRSFVLGLDDPIMVSVLADSIDMIKAVGKLTLIEGVETHEQAATMEDMGIDYIQGFYYSKPLSETDFLEFMRKHRQ